MKAKVLSGSLSRPQKYGTEYSIKVALVLMWKYKQLHDDMITMTLETGTRYLHWRQTADEV